MRRCRARPDPAQAEAILRRSAKYRMSLDGAATALRRSLGFAERGGAIYFRSVGRWVKTSFSVIDAPRRQRLQVAPALREILVRNATFPASASTKMTTTRCTMSCEPGGSCMTCSSVANMTGFAELEAQNRGERSRPRPAPYRRNPGYWLCLDPMLATLVILWPLPRATELAVRKNAKLQSADLPWQLRESPP
jgi:hypothetical protein